MMIKARVARRLRSWADRIDHHGAVKRRLNPPMRFMDAVLLAEARRKNEDGTPVYDADQILDLMRVVDDTPIR